MRSVSSSKISETTTITTRKAAATTTPPQQQLQQLPPPSNTVLQSSSSSSSSSSSKRPNRYYHKNNSYCCCDTKHTTATIQNHHENPHFKNKRLRSRPCCCTSQRHLDSTDDDDIGATTTNPTILLLPQQQPLLRISGQKRLQILLRYTRKSSIFLRLLLVVLGISFMIHRWTLTTNTTTTTTVTMDWFSTTTTSVRTTTTKQQQRDDGDSEYGININCITTEITNDSEPAETTVSVSHTPSTQTAEPVVVVGIQDQPSSSSSSSSQRHNHSATSTTLTVTNRPMHDVFEQAQPLGTTTATATLTAVMDVPNWLNDYIVFHQRHVRPLSLNRRRKRHPPSEQRPSRYRLHVSNINSTPTTNDTAQPPMSSSSSLSSSSNNIRILTYHCNGKNCGGLGDRIFGMIQAFYIAVCTQRIFVIDYHTTKQQDNDDQYGLYKYIEPSMIQWYMDTSNIDEINDDNTIHIRAMDNPTHSFLLHPIGGGSGSSRDWYDTKSPYNNNSNIRLQTNVWLGETFMNGQCWQNHIRQYDTATASSSVDNENTTNNNHPTSPSTQTSDAASTTTADDLFRMAFHTLFRPSKQLQQTVSRLRHRANLPDIENNNTVNTEAPTPPVVAMHIRTGLLDTQRNDVMKTKKKKGIISKGQQDKYKRHDDPMEWMQFLQCAYKIQQRLLDVRWCETQPGMKNIDTDEEKYFNSNHTASAKNIDLYLATDHISVKEYLLKEDNTIKMIRDLPIYHVDDGTKAINNNRNRGFISASKMDTNNDGEMMAWGELMILQSSTCIVLSHSKYSSVAAILSRHVCTTFYDDCGDDFIQTIVRPTNVQSKSEREKLLCV